MVGEFSEKVGSRDKALVPTGGAPQFGYENRAPFWASVSYSSVNKGEADTHCVLLSNSASS